MFELVFLGPCTAPRGAGRAFGGPISPQFPPGTTFPLAPGQRLVMGRVPNAGILVESLIVARHHAAVTLDTSRDPVELRVENLGGGGGVFTRGTYFADETRLGLGGIFELGGVLAFGFRTVGGDELAAR